MLKCKWHKIWLMQFFKVWVLGIAKMIYHKIFKVFFKKFNSWKMNWLDKMEQWGVIIIFYLWLRIRLNLYKLKKLKIMNNLLLKKMMSYTTKHKKHNQYKLRSLKLKSNHKANPNKMIQRKFKIKFHLKKEKMIRLSWIKLLLKIKLNLYKMNL